MLEHVEDETHFSPMEAPSITMQLFSLLFAPILQSLPIAQSLMVT